MSSSTPPAPPQAPLRARFRPQFSMRALLIVVTTAAVVLGLWSWLALSVPLAFLLLVRLAQIAGVVFLVEGAVASRGRTQQACRGALVGATIALLHSPVEYSVWGSLGALVAMVVYALAGGWAGIRAHAWWSAASAAEPTEGDFPKS